MIRRKTTKILYLYEPRALARADIRNAYEAEIYRAES